MGTGMPNPNAAMALQNHFLSKVSKLKIANLAPTSLFKLSISLSTEFPIVSDQHLLPWKGQIPHSTELVVQALPPPWEHIWGAWSKPWVHPSRADLAIILLLTQAIPGVPWGEHAWGRWTPPQGVQRKTSFIWSQPVRPGMSFAV